MRSEAISVDTHRLAGHALNHMGLTCLQALPVAKGQRTKLTIRTVYERSKKAGARFYYFQRPKHAERVLAEMISSEPLTSRTEDGGVVVEAGVEYVDAAIAECLKWCSIKPVTSAEIEARLASVEQQIGRALVRLQRTGAMSALNQEYKALRARQAAPPFKVWLTKQLEQRVLQFLVAAA